MSMVRVTELPDDRALVDARPRRPACTTGPERRLSIGRGGHAQLPEARDVPIARRPLGAEVGETSGHRHKQHGSRESVLCFENGMETLPVLDSTAASSPRCKPRTDIDHGTTYLFLGSPRTRIMEVPRNNNLLLQAPACSDRARLACQRISPDSSELARHLLQRLLQARPRVSSAPPGSSRRPPHFPPRFFRCQSPLGFASPQGARSHLSVSRSSPSRRSRIVSRRAQPTSVTSPHLRRTYDEQMISAAASVDGAATAPARLDRRLARQRRLQLHQSELKLADRRDPQRYRQGREPVGSRHERGPGTNASQGTVRHAAEQPAQHAS
ncbi:hypothetical protein Q5P01_000132 [Channa striata]|uniref:Uncharacterized protein n=1 Tax=Channa striata TaxID=64152 RepID=A0AA88IJ76_CHASR|nr:hypothetical protein Q5P01_000132 [Channa striata]